MDTDNKVLGFFMRHFNAVGCNIPRNTELEKFIVRKHKLELSLRNSLHSERHKEWLSAGLETEKYKIYPVETPLPFPIMFNENKIGNSNPKNELPTPCVELYCLLNSGGKNQVDCINELADRMNIPNMIFEVLPSPENVHYREFGFSGHSLTQKPDTFVFFKDSSQGHMLAFINATGRANIVLPTCELTCPRNWYAANSILHIPPEGTIPLNTNIVENEKQRTIILTDSLLLATQNSPGHLPKNTYDFNTIFSSWYGDSEGIAHCDWNSFRGRTVYYLLHPHSGFTGRQIYETAHAAYEAIMSFTSVRFVTYFAPNQNLSSSNPMTTAIPRIISPETFLNEMNQDNNRVRFSKRSFLIPETSGIPTKSICPFIFPYMSQGSINVFQPKTGSGASLYEFYMPLAIACAQQFPLWGFNTTSCSGNILQIYGSGEISTFQGRTIEVLNTCRENGMREYFAIPSIGFNRLYTLVCKDSVTKYGEYIEYELKNRTLDIMEGTANIINSYLSQRQGTGLLILDFSTLNELFFNDQSPLWSLLQYVQRCGTTIWLILHKALPPERLRILNPDSIFTIDKKKCASITHMNVDIHLNRAVSPDTVTKMKFAFDEEHRAYVTPKESRSKYSAYALKIRSMTAQCVPEIEIARQLGIKLATLKQIKRTFKIRVNKAPKTRRKDISKKIFELHKQGKSESEIANKLGVNVSYV